MKFVRIMLLVGAMFGLAACAGEPDIKWTQSVSEDQQFQATFVQASPNGLDGDVHTGMIVQVRDKERGEAVSGRDPVLVTGSTGPSAETQVLQVIGGIVEGGVSGFVNGMGAALVLDDQNCDDCGGAGSIVVNEVLAGATALSQQEQGQESAVDIDVRNRW